MFVAGGIGITVFRSMLRFIADERLPYRVTLVYSNRDRESAAFLDELEELEERIEGLRRRPDDDRRRRLGGRDAAGSTQSVLGELVGELEREAFLVAGPPAMAEAVGRRARGGRRPGRPGAGRQVQRLLSRGARPGNTEC